MSAHINLELALRILAIGTGATVVMDLWSLLLERMGQPAPDFALFGRLGGHLLRGTRPPAGIAKAAPVPGEALIGWTLHYAIGIAFAALLVLAMGLEWARAPTLPPALLTGVVTVVAPLFILQPAMGAGVASSRTATPMLNNLRSLANHAVFGVGLYLAAVASACVR